jgi:hypothetical protein
VIFNFIVGARVVPDLSAYLELKVIEYSFLALTVSLTAVLRKSDFSQHGF